MKNFNNILIEILYIMHNDDFGGSRSENLTNFAVSVIIYNKMKRNSKIPLHISRRIRSHDKCLL